MKKIFLLMAFTGIVSAASASSLIVLTKGTVISFCGDEKKQEGKKKCNKNNSCCKSKHAEASASSGCSAAKTGTNKAIKSSAKSNSATAQVKDKQVEAVTPTEFK